MSRKIFSFPLELNDVLYKVFYRSRLKKLSEFRRIESSLGYTCKSYDELKCIFVHIPKCAGISVCKSLFGNLGGGHASIRDYKIVFGNDRFNQYFKFSFVRNPWDRLVSTYLFLKNGGINEEDANWAYENLREFSDFNSFVNQWVTEKNIYSYIHFVPQHKFLCIPGSSDPKLDFLGRFENLENDFNYVQERLGITANLQHKNASKMRAGNYRNYYTRESRRRVYEVYKEDIKLFGYEFNVAAGV